MANVLKVYRWVRGTDQVNTALNDAGIASRSVVQWYKVSFDAYNWTEDQAENATDGVNYVPPFGELLGDSLESTLKRKSTRRDPDGPMTAVVQCQYDTTPLGNISTTKFNVSATINPVEVSQDAYVDANGNAILNGAGQYFNPSVKETFYDQELAVSFESYTLDTTSINNCQGCVNSGQAYVNVNGVQLSFGLNTLLFKAPRISVSNAGNPPYPWKVQYVFQWRPDTWVQSILNKGLMGLANGKLYQIKDQFGQPVKEPVLLDASGALLGAGVQPTIANGGVLQFWTLYSADFTGLLNGA